jgi:hypothetical protein
MEGSDALLAARLAAGDDRALAEVFDQLAPSVGIPEGTAKSRLRLAMAKLETVLDRQLLEST